MEVFMDDFTVYVESCIDIDLVLIFEKCHFMVIERIVLGHLVSNKGIKVDIISSLPNPASVWEVRSFLRHAGFNRRFIKNFNKIALPLSNLLQKDVDFNFDQLEYPFELMCDSSKLALGVVLGQRTRINN
ncbi:Retrovirus-related Pol polyprotein, partial [Mucuna pruriens]